MEFPHYDKLPKQSPQDALPHYIDSLDHPLEGDGGTFYKRDIMAAS